MENLLHNQMFVNWVLLPLGIFCARVLDVSIGTVRIILLSRGMKVISPFLGFLEMMIWLLAFRQVILNVANVACLFAFAGGFAMGNYIGIVIEEKLAIGLQVIRVITNKDATELLQYLRGKGYGVTCVDAQGSTGKVNILFMVIPRSEQSKVVEIINQLNPQAFYSVEDIKQVKEGIFPKSNRWKQLARLNFKLY